MASSMHAFLFLGSGNNRYIKIETLTFLSLRTSEIEMFKIHLKIIEV